MSRYSGTFVHTTVANEIGSRIVRGDYPPGTFLPNEAEWSAMFGVSRSAVREAVKMLMAKNLLASRPKIGSWVMPRERWNLLDRDVLGWYAASPNRYEFLKTVQEFRYIIEPEAAAMAAIRHGPEQMADITAACRDMGTAPTLGERTAADTRFHVAILQAAGNELLLPLGVLIELGAGAALRLRHAGGEQPSSCPGSSRGDREEYPDAPPGRGAESRQKIAGEHRQHHRRAGRGLRRRRLSAVLSQSLA